MKATPISTPSEPGAPKLSSETATGTSVLVRATLFPEQNGSAITSVQWQIKKSTEKWSDAVSSTSTVWYKIFTGLDRGVAYDIRSRGVNAVGNGAWSNVVAITTRSAVVPNAPSLRGRRDNSSAHIYLDEDVTDTNGESITNWQWRWKLSEHSGFSNPISTGTQAYAQAGTSALWDAEYQMRAVNEAGAGEWSETLALDSAAVVPVAPALHATRHVVGGISYFVSLPTSEDDLAPTSFRVRYRKSTITEWTLASAVSSGNGTFDADLTSTYLVQAQAQNAKGWGAWSSSVSVGTSAIPISAPPQPPVAAFFPSSNVLANNAPFGVGLPFNVDTKGLPIREWQIQVRTAPVQNGTFTNWTDLGNSADETFAYYTPALTAQVYQFQYRIRTDGGWSPYSPILTRNFSP